METSDGSETGRNGRGVSCNIRSRGVSLKGDDSVSACAETKSWESSAMVKSSGDWRELEKSSETEQREVQWSRSTSSFCFFAGGRGRSSTGRDEWIVGIDIAVCVNKGSTRG